MAGLGQRVMAAAQRDLASSEFDPDGDLLGYVKDLEVTSLVGMVDPPREQSRGAVAEAQAAHIRVRMVTGDDVTTGAAIATQLGIPGEAILGADFAALPEPERLERIDNIGVVGRVAPEHKVVLVDTLKKKGDVVAMTGDGVNDAPAIKAADIGIAMGSGTEVAKNAGRMILSDDNFATIVYAVEQGRKIFDNLTKYIRFVLVLLVVFVLTFLGASLFNIAAGEPFNPAQVLWIHFFVNAAFGFALGFDSETPGLMRRVPKPRGQSVLTGPLLVTVGLSGLVITIGLLGMIQVGTSIFGSVAVGRSIAFTAFAFCLIVAALECRSETESILTPATFQSRQMNRALIIEFILAVLTTQMDALRRLLDTTQLGLHEFGWALLPPAGLLVLWELGKLIARRRPSPATSGSELTPIANTVGSRRGPNGRRAHARRHAPGRSESSS
jgi:Ca2+-transporting ATPase